MSARGLMRGRRIGARTRLGKDIDPSDPDKDVARALRRASGSSRPTDSIDEEGASLFLRLALLVCVVLEDTGKNLA